MSGAGDRIPGEDAAPQASGDPSATAAKGPGAEPPPAMLSVDVPGLCAQFARSFVLLFPVYVLGYLGLSFLWILLGLLLLFWCRRNKGHKTSRFYRALAFLSSEPALSSAPSLTARYPGPVSPGKAPFLPVWAPFS